VYSRAVPILPLILWGCRVEIGAPADAVEASAVEAPRGEVWIYTSMYQPVIDAIDPQIRERWPDLDPQWYQAGSEKVAQRVETEWAAGGSKACLLLTSDPFWYADLARQGRLQPYLAPNVLHVERGLTDPDGYWVASRISLMVLAVNGARLAPEARPRRFADLAAPAWKGRVTMPDPLASGTAFTTLAFWSRDPGWDFVAALRDNDLVAAGGNSSVMTRLESGEKDAGVLLIENVLAGRRKGSPVEVILPEDGAIAVPGPIALTAGCPNPGGARAVYDFLLSADGQRAFVAGDLYAARPEIEPPAGAPPLSAIAVQPWSSAFVAEMLDQRAALKDRWAAP
jgi:iron(III) transport system substrate-binding protein